MVPLIVNGMVYLCSFSISYLTLTINRSLVKPVKN